MSNLPLSTRPVRDRDLEWLLELRLVTMGGHFEASGHVLSDEEQRERLRDQYAATRIIRLDGSNVGMLKVAREPNVWHLIQVQVVPDHQRRGIGTAVIEALLDEAREARVPVSLHVLKVNPAKRLYARLGFEVVEDLGHSYEMRSGA